MTIQQAVILAAGFGSRFAPITRVIPKPMLPIGNRPALDFVIDELTASGITKIIIVVGHRKAIIEEYYQHRTDIHFVVQNKMNGTAPALYLAKELLRHEPFALCYSDEVMEGDPPCMQQLIEAFDTLGADAVTGIEAVDEAKIRMYNSVSFNAQVDNLVQLTAIIEKPQAEYPTSYTSIGRYVFSPRILAAIEQIQLDHDDSKETYITEALQALIPQGNVYGLKYQGKRWDIGTKEGWIATNNALGLK